MIKHLRYKQQYFNNDANYAILPPDNGMITEKINEIIDVLNEMEASKHDGNGIQSDHTEAD